MRLALSLLALAVVTALVDRMVGRRAPRPVGRAAPRAVVRVCLSLPVGVDWRDVVLQYIQRATDPRRLRFSVLLECSEARQALLGDADDLFRGRAVVQHVRAPRDPDDHVGRVRRLVRRCVAGDETLVVLADRRVRAAPGWDETLLALVGQEAVVLSAPVSAHPVAFPCLAPVDGGAAAVRAASRPFADASRTVAVPSVCRCLEFVAAAPHAPSSSSRAS